MTDQAQIDQIKQDVADLQAAGAAAAAQIAALTDQVLALQAGDISDEQIANLHNALAEVTSSLNAAVQESQEALAPPGEDEQR